MLIIMYRRHICFKIINLRFTKVIDLLSSLTNVGLSKSSKLVRVLTIADLLI